MVEFEYWSTCSVGAADGVISLFDSETGEELAATEVDQHLTNDKVTIAFDGESKIHVAETLYVDVVDGGLDQVIERRLKDLGKNVEIGDADNITRTQRYTVADETAKERSKLNISVQRQVDKADANYCGDINLLTVFDVDDTEHELFSPEDGFDSLDKQSFDAVEKALSAANKIETQNGAFITAKYSDALSSLLWSLGFDSTGGPVEDRPTCQEEEIFGLFGLSLDSQTKRLDMSGVKAENYLIFGYVRGFEVEYDIFVYFDAKSSRIVSYLYW